MAKGTKFKNVLTKSCLYRRYPQQGKYAGGIVFYRCYGIGSGLGFTKGECSTMWGDISLDDHVMLVGGSSAVTDTAPNTAAATNTAPNTTTATNTTPRPGDCIEVWWEDQKQWYPGVVTDEAPGYDDTVASQIAYDDDKRRYWHNLEVQEVIATLTLHSCNTTLPMHV